MFDAWAPALHGDDLAEEDQAAQRLRDGPIAAIDVQRAGDVAPLVLFYRVRTGFAECVYRPSCWIIRRWYAAFQLSGAVSRARRKAFAASRLRPAALYPSPNPSQTRQSWPN